jgi:hypothetical protein
MKKHWALIVPAALLGVALIVIGIVYWVEPASSLPGFFPGHQAGSSHHHLKHGIAAFLLGLAVLAFAWFQSGSATDRASERTDGSGSESPAHSESQR